MRNKILFILASVIAIGVLLPMACYAQPKGTPNLLKNPGFENGLANWQPFPGNQWTCVPAPQSGYMLSYSGSVLQDWADVSQVVPYGPNMKFYASVDYSTAPDFLVDYDHFGGMVIYFLNANGEIIIRFPEPKQDASRSGWQKLYAEGVTPPGTAAIRYTLFHYFRLHDNPWPTSDSGLKFFDNAYLSTVKQPSQQSTGFALMNGGFEDGLSYWNRSYVGYWQAESDVVYSGMHAVKNTEGSYTWIEQKLNLQPGETADASVMATGDNGFGYNNAFLELSLYDENGNLVELKQKMLYGGGWQQLSLSATMPDNIPQGTAVMGIRVFRHDPPATFYFDNATLTKSRSAAKGPTSKNKEIEASFTRNILK